MDLSTITVSDFKALFVRDFTYGATSDKIMDADISRAFSEAKANFNQSLFSDDDILKLAYLYLTAHYMVLDLRTSMSGIAGGGEFSVASKSAGSISESYAIPAAYIDNPLLSYFAKTGYGQKYLSIVMPRLVGNIGAVGGWTNP